MTGSPLPEREKALVVPRGHRTQGGGHTDSDWAPREPEISVAATGNPPRSESVTDWRDLPEGPNGIISRNGINHIGWKYTVGLWPRPEEM